MDEVLTSTLQRAVFGRLDYLERLADEGDQQSKAVLADSEIARLTGAFRALLAVHAPDELGRCRSCTAGPWRRRVRCTVWKAAYRHLVGDTADRTTPAGRHSLRKPARQPT
ncbi:hypothetical protein [Amycolatopsis sp. H20-H5]|uniref:hypothetical protein n=1 Tax=Amycolatopsis sp. H20-H5 TaxID=3046309 RepID=UPI002DBB35F5|nr:hypothetical protein [Amycolatopsis sp. H20-H5]MEC3974282.1 hypothetical protein [Amycolatopsis sp. H20-H5]